MKAQIETGRRISKVVITRSSKGNRDLAEKLRSRGFEPVPIETIEFLPPKGWSLVDSSLRALSEFDWVVFTSGTGVSFFASRMESLSIPLAWRAKPFVAAIGEKTSEELQKVGVRVDFVPSSYTTKTLADELPRGQGKRVLILRADIGSPGFVPRLERNGFQVNEVVIYRHLHGHRGGSRGGA